jgi:hypothetical protein
MEKIGSGKWNILIVVLGKTWLWQMEKIGSSKLSSLIWLY